MDDLSLEIFNSLVGKDIKIIGERKEEYEGEVCEGSNCDFQYSKTNLTKDVICIECEGKKYEIAMHNTYGECPSGWTTASWSFMEIREVKEFKKMTHKIKKPTVVRISKELSVVADPDSLGIFCGDDRIVVLDDSWSESVSFDSLIFSWEPIGGDGWYPNGNYRVNDDAFIEIGRQEEIESKKSEPTVEQLEEAKKQFLAFFKATIPQLPYRQVRKPVFMNDGEYMSVQASGYHYCIPRVNGLERYDCYEIGFPSSLFEELADRGEEPNTTHTVFPGVEEDVIARIIAKHGGIDFERSLEPEQLKKMPKVLKRNPQDMALDQLQEMVANLAKLVEEQRKAIEAMRCMTRPIDHNPEN